MESNGRTGQAGPDSDHVGSSGGAEGNLWDPEKRENKSRKFQVAWKDADVVCWMDVDMQLCCL